MHYEDIHSKLLTAFPPEQAEVLAQVIHEAYTDLVKTSDFNELKEIVRDLSLKMGELAEAQKRTEQRLEELAEAQKRTEQRVEELAEAQRETQKEVGRLDRALQELAEAQRRTEEALQTLASEHAETRRQLGGLTATVGYRLEDEAFKALPLLLERDYGLVVKDRLKRKFVRDNHGIDIEVNIIGEAERNGEILTIIGESKSQLSKRDIDNFIRKKLKRLEGVFTNIFPVLVTYMVTEPDVEDYAKEKGIALYYSYDF
jgi:DNA repair exonuclease SbcCD ATPase subunit